MSEAFLTEGRFCFDFSKAICAYKADMPTLNGLGGVDFIIELADQFIFIELKDLEHKKVPSDNRAEWVRKLKITKENLFLSDLGVKFKDTIIRKWANNEEFDKPIYYIVILELNVIDAALKMKLSEDLSGKLPTCISEKYGFKKNIRIKRREIINIKDWEKKYPEFSVREKAY